MDDVVLVTGAFGLVGTARVAHLGARGRSVVATDLDTPANRAGGDKLPYYRQPGRYANPWEAVRNRWGAPEADRRTP